jgi:hypothetical protein
VIVACPVLEPYLQTAANENNLHAIFLGVITQNPPVPKLPQRSVHEMMLQLAGIDITRCPLCQSRGCTNSGE